MDKNQPGFLDRAGKILEIVKDMPKILASVLLVISFVAGYGALKPEEETSQTIDRFYKLDRRLLKLEAEKAILNKLLIKVLSSRDNDGFDVQSYLIEIPPGKITKTR